MKIVWCFDYAFWIIWLLLFILVVTNFWYKTSLNSFPVLDWWQKTVIYHIYLVSFKDSNHDGKGDIQGLISKLDYFKYLKVESLLISPFYPSPMKDNGYDITNYTEVDPMYGTMEDFNCLLKKTKQLGMNLLVDFVANHTSDQHIWFLKSIQKLKPYDNYYVWVDPKIGPRGFEPPNNWVSVFGGPAWTWNAARHQYYLHQFLPEQPDLNLQNKLVRKELSKILLFWLKKGISGIRVDAASHLFEDRHFHDEPVAKNTMCKPGEYDYLDHIYTKGQPENLEILQEWRHLLDNFYWKTGKYKILITETTESLTDTMRYYGSIKNPLADIPLNFRLLDVKEKSSPTDLFKAITYWTKAMPKGKYPNWVLGSHDYSRLATRATGDLLDGLHMVVLLLQGTPFCYYGDELGMENVSINSEEIRDSFALRTTPENSRDPSRTPMQWNDNINAGFTTYSKPWLPVHLNYKLVNVKAQKSSRMSHLCIYARLVELRNEPSILFGLTEYPVVNSSIFSMARILENSKSYLIVLNMSKNIAKVDFTGKSNFFSKTAYLEITNNRISYNHMNETKKFEMRLNNVSLHQKECIVLSFYPVV